ncbi:MAG: Endodeoxyribonuclease RusA [Geminicoccaceae bacterium]|jgi:Holliday junction resolvase RusA-like endonuclease|nr:Endodeoxyribonuclease RusA [Geminicoccaceae bacterium]
MSRWPAGELLAVGPIRVNVTHVFVSVAVDLDNLAKPVLDALKGVGSKMTVRLATLG